MSLSVYESNKFRRWLSGIKDPTIKGRIISHISKLIDGLSCDIKPIGHGLSELRMHLGAGYRVYFYEDQGVLILLLAGGDKKSQRRDIKKAHLLYEYWSNNNGYDFQKI
ncbi:type II toxin-antitoxin system RelE/ParE family toxin [Idiomarina sp. ATCH4]|nr:type II toxin-antitoxin system RelE/ParE family toxin [Idiomarina sp. ATCH4]MCK7459182.1 type II toxin-antitoxin system RelE/ParE family toxin [Idiomarina sp. ATCH4]